MIGTSDATVGIRATTNGYYTVSFADGSALWLKFAGANKAPTGKGAPIVIGGTGRHAGAKGEGIFETTATSGRDAF